VFAQRRPLWWYLTSAAGTYDLLALQQQFSVALWLWGVVGGVSIFSATDCLRAVRCPVVAGTLLRGHDSERRSYKFAPGAPYAERMEAQQCFIA